jgi:hypothetical protein
MADASGKGVCEKKDATVTVKPEINDFPVLLMYTSYCQGTTGSDGCA